MVITLFLGQLLYGILYPDLVLALEKSQSCQIEAVRRIIYLSSSDTMAITPDDLIEKSNCPIAIEEKFFKILLSFKEGRDIKADHVEKLLKKNFLVSLKPRTFHLQTLIQVIKDQISLPPSWNLSRIRFLGVKRNIISLSNGEDVKVKCQNCDRTGIKNIEVSILKQGYKKRSFWLTADLKIKTKALISQKNLGPLNGSMNVHYFKEGFLDSFNPEKFFINRNILSFFKLNRPLNSGRPLLATDLTPLNLVQRGVPSRIIFKKNGLTLSGPGIPLTSGSYGNIIKLRNPKSKKIIVGKIVDFNKIMIEL